MGLVPVCIFDRPDSVSNRPDSVSNTSTSMLLLFSPGRMALTNEKRMRRRGSRIRTNSSRERVDKGHGSRMKRLGDGSRINKVMGEDTGYWTFAFWKQHGPAWY